MKDTLIQCMFTKTFSGVARHAIGQVSAQEADFIPESEWPKVFRAARIWVGIYAVVIGTALYLHSWLPLMLVGLPSLYGAWLGYLFGLTQHVGLAEDVLDHRSNCRTIYMNRVLRFIYMDMNYHLEHHMYPMVPYHALAQLHEEIRNDCPPPYANISRRQGILPTIWSSARSEYFIRPEHQRTERGQCPGACQKLRR